LEKALGLRSDSPLADIALDGYNLEGGATTLDALWAGVPVVVTSGSPYGNRGCYKMLEVGGLPEMIGADLREYKRIAVELALNPEKLAAVRAKLVANNETSPLFNVALFTRHFERGLEMMWNNFEAGQPPKDLTVPILD
jgi:protein O-GlcNAc transferase